MKHLEGGGGVFFRKQFHAALSFFFCSVFGVCGLFEVLEISIITLVRLHGDPVCPWARIRG